MAFRYRLRIASSLLALLILGSSLWADTGDWQAVQNLTIGTLISVKTSRRYPCLFDSATQDDLICKPPDHRLLGLPRTMTFPRRDIREVRIERNQGKDAWIGAGMGAGAGAAIGASKSSNSRGIGAFIGALGGALIGGVTGGLVSTFRHGKIIYRR